MSDKLHDEYIECHSKGHIHSAARINFDAIQTFLTLAEEDLKTIADLKLTKTRINTLYKLNYEVIHTLAEAVLLLDKIKVANHLCLFACLCFKHPDLNLNYEFLETIRQKRNKINYEGSLVLLDDWNKIESVSEIHITNLINYINSKIKYKSF